MVLTARLTELITVEQFVGYTGETYMKGEKWIPVRQVYASILNQRGNTSFNQLPGNVYSDNISFYLRWISLEKKGFRIRYDNQIYEIGNITTIQRNEALVIDCIAVQ